MRWERVTKKSVILSAVQRRRRMTDFLVTRFLVERRLTWGDGLLRNPASLIDPAKLLAQSLRHSGSVKANRAPAPNCPSAQIVPP